MAFGDDQTKLTPRVAWRNSGPFAQSERLSRWLTRSSCHRNSVPQSETGQQDRLQRRGWLRARIFQRGADPLLIHGSSWLIFVRMVTQDKYAYKSVIVTKNIP